MLLRLFILICESGVDRSAAMRRGAAFSAVPAPDHDGSSTGSGIFLFADPPVEVGRSRAGEELLAPAFVRLADVDSRRALMISASSSAAADESAARFFVGNNDLTSWAEVAAPGNSSNIRIGVCLPPTNQGVVCLPQGSVLERDPQ
eukprot:SAG31_NODE_490_length_14932_cov_9.350300_10_plen_146_part_00